MPSDKPTTSELIQELRSISDYLSDEQSSSDNIPILTEIADKTGVDNPTDKDLEEHHPGNPTSKAERIKTSGAGTSDDISLDNNTDQVQDPATEKPKTSLFDKPLQPKQKTVKSTDNKNKSRHLEMKAQGENPFLPPHIRKQLGQHKKTTPIEAPHWPKSSSGEDEQTNAAATQKIEVQGDLLNGFAESMVETPEGKASTETGKSIELIVDEVVKELLPQVETRLREKLKINIAAWKDSE